VGYGAAHLPHHGQGLGLDQLLTLLFDDLVRPPHDPEEGQVEEHAGPKGGGPE